MACKTGSISLTSSQTQALFNRHQTQISPCQNQNRLRCPDSIEIQSSIPFGLGTASSFNRWIHSIIRCFCGRKWQNPPLHGPWSPILFRCPLDLIWYTYQTAQSFKPEGHSTSIFHTGIWLPQFPSVAFRISSTVIEVTFISRFRIYWRQFEIYITHDF